MFIDDNDHSLFPVDHVWIELLVTVLATVSPTSIVYPDNGVCAYVRHGGDVTSHLGPYQCVYCERYSDVATL